MENIIKDKKKRKTIAILFGDLGIGGIQKKIADLTEFLKKNEKIRYKIVIILEWNKNLDLEKDIFLERVEKFGAEVFYKPQLGFRRFSFPYTLYILWKTWHLKPDSILSFMESYSLAAIFVKLIYFFRKIKVVVSYDNVPSIYLSNAFDKKTEYKWKFLLRYLFKYADKIVVPSNESARDFKNNFFISKNLLVNKNWVSGKFLKEKNEVDKKYDLIYVGRIDKQKNLISFVEIVEELKKRKKISAAILGWGEEVTNLINAIYERKLEKNIVLLGSDIDSRKYLQISRIFLLTSFYEGLPIAALEGMAAGLPVVTSNYPGSRELVKDGVTGFVCKDKKDFVSKIEKLLSDKYQIKRMGESGRKYVLKNHSEKNLRNFAQLLI